MRDVKVSLVGYGIVGHGVVDVLSRKKSLLREMGLNLKLISVTDHTGTVLAEEGVDAEKILGERTLQNVATSGMKGKEAVGAIDSDLVIEVTPTNIVHGQPGLGHMEAALSTGKHVVTSNKGPLVVAYSRLRSWQRITELCSSSRQQLAAPCHSSAWWRERLWETPSMESGAYSTAPATTS
jgi:homoserine dehydrogenase